jgi:hypothetical protein
MRKFIFTLILLLAGYIGYMYFFGKGEDKANAKTVVVETKDLAKGITDFLSHQKEKYDNAEFDQLMQKVEVGVQNLKTSTKQESDIYWNQLRDVQIELLKIDSLKLTVKNRRQYRETIKELHEVLKS